MARAHRSQAGTATGHGFGLPGLRSLHGPPRGYHQPKGGHPGPRAGGAVELRTEHPGAQCAVEGRPRGGLMIRSRVCSLVDGRWSLVVSRVIGPTTNDHRPTTIDQRPTTNDHRPNSGPYHQSPLSSVFRRTESRARTPYAGLLLRTAPLGGRCAVQLRSPALGPGCPPLGRWYTRSSPSSDRSPCSPHPCPAAVPVRKR